MSTTADPRLVAAAVAYLHGDTPATGLAGAAREALRAAASGRALQDDEEDLLEMLQVWESAEPADKADAEGLLRVMTRVIINGD